MGWTGAVYPFAAPLAGIVVGALLAGARERGQWLREQQLRAYAEFVAAARDMLFRGADAVSADAPETAVERDRVRDAMQHLRDAETVVQLVAPADIESLASKVRTYFGDALFDHFTGKHSDPQVVDRASDLAKDFRISARRSVRRRRPQWFE